MIFLKVQKRTDGSSLFSLSTRRRYNRTSGSCLFSLSFVQGGEKERAAYHIFPPEVGIEWPRTWKSERKMPPPQGNQKRRKK